MQKVSLMLMVVVFSTFFTTFSHTHTNTRRTHTQTRDFLLVGRRKGKVPSSNWKKQQKKEAEKTANCESIFDFT